MAVRSLGVGVRIANDVFDNTSLLGRVANDATS